MILVTGGTGLVGSHLLYDLIVSGLTVRALKRPGSNTAATLRTFSYYSDTAADLFSKIEWVDGDVLDFASLEDAMEGVGQVYHAAAVVCFFSK
jgi:dihydroflavonol-4-reductase